jgi:DNA-directed RNA polymerase specialized sigma24 family protein
MKKKKKLPKNIKKKVAKPSKDYLHGVDETLFLEALDKITKKLIYKFKFGYHEAEDMKQQATVFAIQGLQFYDKKRPLENFLWTHVRNRLFNYKRDNYQRPDKPCLTCPFFDKSYCQSDNQCSKYKDKSECEPYNSWETKNSSKKNIMKPLAIDYLNDTAHSFSSSELIKNKEIIDLIDKNLPIKLRPAYLNFMANQKIPKKDYNVLIETIKQILNIEQERGEDEY